MTPLEYLRLNADGGNLAPLYAEFRAWDSWCADVYDSHTSYPMLLWFRSRQPGRSWTVGLAMVLEAASYVMSTVELPRHHEAQLLYRRAVMLLDSINLDEQTTAAEPPVFDEAQLRAQFEQVHAAIVELGLPARPFEDAYRREQALRADYLPSLLRLNRALLAPLEFRTHARPIPIEMS